MQIFSKKRQTVYVRTELPCFMGGLVSNVIKELQRSLDTHGDNATLDVYFENGEPCYYVQSRHVETDAEYEARCRKGDLLRRKMHKDNTKRKAKLEKFERKLLERLTKKYSPHK